VLVADGTCVSCPRTAVVAGGYLRALFAFEPLP
jgi:hypothetical protein